MSDEPPQRKRSRAEDWALLGRFWPEVAPDRRLVWLGLAAVPLMSAAGAAQPWLLKQAIDGPISAAVQHRVSQGWSLGGLTLAFLAAVVLEYGARSLQLYALQLAGYRALKRLRRRTFLHVLGQGAAFFDQRATGNLLTRTITDVEAVGEVLTFGIVGIAGDVFDIALILGAMAWLDLPLTGWSLLAAPVVVLLVNFFRRRLRFHATEIRRSMASASGFFQEALAGAKVIQLHGRQATTLDEYREVNRRYLDAYRISNWYDASLYAVMDGVASLCIALLVWFGGGRAVQGAVSVGLLVAFIQYIQRLFVPVRELSGKVATIERAMAALERIYGLHDVDQRLSEGKHAPTEVRGQIEVRDLSFGYHADGPLALDGVSLQVQPGELVALVGPTGSGKSSLAKLLTRMYAAPNDSIRLDGVALEQWQLAALRRSIGVVQQDVVLFSGTLYDNVALGRPLDRAKVAAALSDARLDGLVARLGGLDAEIAAGGANLSTGERQLLAIARVLAADPPVVVLDEATASIDTETEQAVQAALDRVFEGRTSVVVAHRLSTIRKAQRIVVLERGRVAEQGSHDELLAHGGLYAKLVQAAQESHQAA